MPELPEVETTKNGIKPYLIGQTIETVIVRQRLLRWPIPQELPERVKGQRIDSVLRRAKYILINLQQGTLIVHLGMSGSLWIVESSTMPNKHDHVDILLTNRCRLRYRDPRRFGTLLWTENDPRQHRLLVSLGPEPFDDHFNGDYLYQHSKNRTISVKSFIMDSHTVVGIGNIYANEALFRAAIHPKRRAGRISKQRYQKLTESIRFVLQEAISQGGTTLRDFVNGEGKPGYFQQTLQVYNRGGEKCRYCKNKIREIRLNQRSTFYCIQCQR